MEPTADSSPSHLTHKDGGWKGVVLVQVLYAQSLLARQQSGCSPPLDHTNTQTGPICLCTMSHSMIMQGQHNLGLPGMRAAVDMHSLKTAASQLTIIHRFVTTWAAGTCVMLQFIQTKRHILPARRQSKHAQTQPGGLSTYAWFQTKRPPPPILVSMEAIKATQHLECTLGHGSSSSSLSSGFRSRWSTCSCVQTQAPTG